MIKPCCERDTDGDGNCPFHPEDPAIVRQRSVVYSLNKKYADALFVVEQTRRVAEQAKQDAISALGELEKIIKEQEKK